MTREFVRSSIATIIVTGTAPIAFSAPAMIYDLGIANGSTGSRGYSINSSGQVAVSSTQLFGQGTASRYDGTPGTGVLRNLGTLPTFQTAFAMGINASGQVAGYAQGSTVSTPSHAFRYDGTPGAGGIMRDLGTLGGLSSEAFAINDLGQVTGYAQSDPNGPNPGTYAFIYTGTPGAGGVMKSLGSLAGPGSTGIAINNAGQVAGTTPVAADGTTHAFRYDGAPGTGVMRDLGVSPGFVNGFAYGMNASGQVVGENDSADGNTAHAFIYKGTPGINGVMTDLLPLPGGTISSAAGVNDAGYVVGISDTPGDLHFHPVLWRPDGSIVNLEQWLASVNPAAAANWDLRDPFITGISNTGLITGDAIYLGAGPDNGRDVAMILDASSLVPEPSCLLFLVSAPLMIRRKR